MTIREILQERDQRSAGADSGSAVGSGWQHMRGGQRR
jgi:hypothetical protein